MFQSLLVTFREGLESLLIVGVIAAYLRKTNRPGLVRGVHIGFGVSVVTCLLGAWLWLQVPNQPLIEGIAALTAALLVGGMLWQMMRMGRHLKARIESRVEQVAAGHGQRPSARAVAGIAVVTALLVTREGLEAVFYVGVQAMAVRASVVPGQKTLVLVGAVIGLFIAGLLSWFWSRVSHRLNLGVVLKVTAVFLAVFLVQLLIYGVHELAESGVIRGSQAFHDATEVLGPDGRIGHLLSYSLVFAPLLYLVWARVGKAKGPRSVAV
ncbi:MAG TPA: FTR1 family protein [Polyangia bacterium]|jgi:high-affinity iron transporter|nr:FTR1 family protein [Polyangia bacterium]